MAQEIGTAYVTVMPSAKGFGKAVEGEIDRGVSSASKSAGGKFQALATGVLKWGTAAVVGVGALITGLAAKGGISRALNIEDAQAKLKGLGHDTQSIETIMTDALAAVKGTAFGLDAAATTAANAVAAGIKPGQELEKYLRLTADAATIAGVSMSEMGSILNKTTTAGKVYSQELNQLADRGLPVFTWLQEAYGVSAEELRKMVAAGKVDAETFRQVLEENIGGAALASGETTRGAFANMMAALSRLGAAFAGPALEPARQLFNEMIVLIDGLTERFAPLRDAFGGWLDGLEIEGLGERILKSLDNLDIGKMLSAAISGRANLLEVGIGLLQQLIDGLVRSTPQLLNTLVSTLERVATMILESAPALLMAAVTLFVGLGTALLDVLPGLIDTVTGLVPMLVESLLAMIPILLDGAIQLFLAIVDAIPVIITSLLEMIPVLLDGAVQLLMAIVEAIPLIIPPLIDALIELLPVLLDTLTSLIPMLVQGAVDLLMAIVHAIPLIIPPLIRGVIELLPVIIDTLIGLIPVLIGAAIDLFTAIVRAVPEIVPMLVETLWELGPEIVGAILALIPQLFEAGAALIGALIDGIGSMFGAVGDMVGGMMDWIGSFFPSSPAKRGPFSGPGWTRLGHGGESVVEEFLGGMQGSLPSVSAAINHLVTVPQSPVAGDVPERGRESSLDRLLEAILAELEKQPDRFARLLAGYSRTDVRMGAI